MNAEPGGDTTALDVSVIVPIVERHDDLSRLYEEYAASLRQLQKSFEFIFVVDGGFRAVLESLKALKAADPQVRIVLLARSFGESVALKAGFSEARGRIILTLASYFQVETSGVREALAGIEEGYDLVISRRHPRVDTLFNRLQSLVFHGIIRWTTGVGFRDVTCGFRAMKREVLEEIGLYGNLHHFIPILAIQAGFKIKEIEIPQRIEEAKSRVFGVGVYLNRLLDIVTIFFLTKFTRKPLRFFGAIGTVVFVAGLGICVYLFLYRLLGSGGIANRPLLLLGVLLVIFGVQSVSIGLVGEIVIFTHARDKDFRIEEIL